MMALSRQIAASYGLGVPILGHAGDGNLHPVVLYEAGQLATVDAIAEEIACAALEFGGTLTGEHGIGTAKRDHMRRAFGPVELAAFRAIKRAFDPDRLLNARCPRRAFRPATPTVVLQGDDYGAPSISSRFAWVKTVSKDNRPIGLHTRNVLRLNMLTETN